MLIRIAICERAVDDALHRRSLAGKLKTLWRAIDERGIGLFASGEEYVGYLERLQPVEAMRWRKLQEIGFVAQVTDPRPGAIQLATSLGGLREQWADRADLIVCGRQQAIERFCLDAEHPLTDDDVTPEVSALAVVEGAEALNQPQVAKRNVVIDERRESVWKERFAVAAAHADELVIVDRFLDPEAFRWLVERYLGARNGVTAKLTLFVQRREDERGKRANASELVGRLTDLQLDQIVVGGGLSRATLNVLPRWDGMKRMHDRHVRFGHRAFALGKGITPFRRPKVDVETSCFVFPFEVSDALIAGLEASRNRVQAEWTRKSGWRQIEGGSRAAIATQPKALEVPR